MSPIWTLRCADTLDNIVNKCYVFFIIFSAAREMKFEVDFYSMRKWAVAMQQGISRAWSTTNNGRYQDRR